MGVVVVVVVVVAAAAAAVVVTGITSLSCLADVANTQETYYSSH